MTNDVRKHLPFEEPNGELERKVRKMKNVEKSEKRKSGKT